MSLSFIGMFFIASAQSLLPIMIGLELMTISTTFMILVHGKKKAEAAVKLFIFGSLAIAIFAFAVSLVFQYDPSLGLSEIPGYAGYIAMVALALFIARSALRRPPSRSTCGSPTSMRVRPPSWRPRSLG